MDLDFTIRLVVRLAGLAIACVAVLRTRTAQAATAWAILLVSFPYVGIPLYLLFGIDRFRGYVRARRFDDTRTRETLNDLQKQLPRYKPPLEQLTSRARVFERLAQVPFVNGNQTDLLINGKDTFEAIFEAIDAAKKHIVLEFYIVRDDVIGRALADKLKAAALRGVKCFLLYDRIGSAGLSRRFVRDLNRNGVRCVPFRSTRSLKAHIQANFRNHRKIVVVDGHKAFIGGHNVGEEYVMPTPGVGVLRDTHARICGPAALEAQTVFVEDWYWSTDERPDLTWEFGELQGTQNALVLATGPADSFDTCGAMFAHAISSSKDCFWLSTPYFIPNPEMLSALRLAVLRNVDVRLYLTAQSDNWMSDLASSTYIADVLKLGARVFLFEGGFMHQKTFVLDHEIASVSTANFDPRSFMLNFEVSLILDDKKFNGQVAEMLEGDAKQCREARLSDYENRPLPTRLLARCARLFSPIL